MYVKLRCCKYFSKRFLWYIC